MKRTDVITLPLTACGPCGAAVPLGPEPDAGGGTEPAMFVIPLTDPKRFDERQTCALVAAYLAQPAADTPDFRACRSYRNGRCGATGWHAPCLFLEAPTAEGWQKARRWRLLPGGGMCPVESYDVMTAYDRDFPHAKPWADDVAIAFGILTDDAGEVIADDLVETDRTTLRFALETACWSDGADRDIEAIMSRYWPGDDDQVTTPASRLYSALCVAAILGHRRRVREAEGRR